MAPVIALVAITILVATIVTIGLFFHRSAASAHDRNRLGVMASAGSAHDLPDPLITPGAVDPRVTQADIGATICVPGYTRTIRPPGEFTTDLKREQLADAARGYTDRDGRDFEEDHLIPLELGGSATDARNLWPEHWTPPWGARTKDRIENELHRRVCLATTDADWLSLEQAQRAIAENWISAYQRYVGQPADQ